jgi:hypothetical protein
MLCSKFGWEKKQGVEVVVAQGAMFAADDRAQAYRMNDSTDKIFQTNPQILARMMELEAGAPMEWRPEELGAILRHQLSAPILFDLEALDPELASKASALGGPNRQFLRTFKDLFHSPQVPLELLVLSKDFAKASLTHPDSPIPKAIAEVIYFASIAVALIQHGQRISRLDDDMMLRCFDRMIVRPWLDEETRALFTQGRQRLTKLSVETSKP